MGVPVALSGRQLAGKRRGMQASQPRHPWVSQVGQLGEEAFTPLSLPPVG